MAGHSPHHLDVGARGPVVFLLLLILAGCGGGSAVDRSTAPSCDTVVPADNPADTVTVVLFDAVDLAHAPWGRNREERFVFSHLYETLVTIDCHGEVQPGLAKSWKRASDGWLLELRDDAHFWDESAVTAKDVAATFIRDEIAIKSIDVVDEQRVLVRGYDGVPDIKLLALQMLAVRRNTESGGPPLGTGAWLIDEQTPVAEAIVIQPAHAMGPVVRFVQGNVSDARDIMDGTADAMITDDPAAIEYARSRSRASLAPLAWDHAYFLISWSRQLETAVAHLPQSLCDELARDVVGKDARGGSSLIVDADATCRTSERPDPGHAIVVPGMAPGDLTYNASDTVARELAERLVALAAMDTSSSTDARAVARAIPELRAGSRASGLGSSEFTWAMWKGDGEAFLFPVSWCADFPFAVCRFDELASWFPRHQFRDRFSRSVLPLVETRAHFIALSDRVGFVDDGAGNARIMINSRGRSR